MKYIFLNYYIVAVNFAIFTLKYLKKFFEQTYILNDLVSLCNGNSIIKLKYIIVLSLDLLHFLMDLTESFTRNGLPGNYQLQVLFDRFVQSGPIS